MQRAPTRKRLMIKNLFKDNKVVLPVTLGHRYRDVVSGFEGVATACYVYMNGCFRVQLEGVDKDNLPKGYVFDQEQCEEVAAPPLNKKAPSATGGSRDSSPVTRS